MKAYTTFNSIDKIVVIKIVSTSLNIRYVKDLDAFKNSKDFFFHKKLINLSTSMYRLIDRYRN